MISMLDDVNVILNASRVDLFTLHLSRCLCNFRGFPNRFGFQIHPKAISMYCKMGTSCFVYDLMGTELPLLPSSIFASLGSFEKCKHVSTIWIAICQPRNISIH